MSTQPLLIVEPRRSLVIRDLILTVLAWLLFIFLFWRGVIYTLENEPAIGPRPLSAVFFQDLTLISFYVLVCLFNAAVLILWAKYNQYRGRVEKRRRREDLSQEELSASFHVPLETLVMLPAFPVITIHNDARGGFAFAEVGNQLHRGAGSIGEAVPAPPVPGGATEPDLSPIVVVMTPPAASSGDGAGRAVVPPVGLSGGPSVPVGLAPGARRDPLSAGENPALEPILVTPLSTAPPRGPERASSPVPDTLLPPLTSGIVLGRVLSPLSSSPRPGAPAVLPVLPKIAPPEDLPPVSSRLAPESVVSPVLPDIGPDEALPPVPATIAPEAVVSPVLPGLAPEEPLPPVSSSIAPEKVVAPVSAGDIADVELPPLAESSAPQEALSSVLPDRASGELLPPGQAAADLEDMVLPVVSRTALQDDRMPASTSLDPGIVPPPVSSGIGPQEALPPVSAEIVPGDLVSPVLPTLAREEAPPPVSGTIVPETASAPDLVRDLPPAMPGPDATLPASRDRRPEGAFPSGFFPSPLAGFYPLPLATVEDPPAAPPFSRFFPDFPSRSVLSGPGVEAGRSGFYPHVPPSERDELSSGGAGVPPGATPVFGGSR